MKNISKIIKISKPLHKLLAIIGLLIIITATLEQVVPLLSKYIVDEIVKQIQTGQGNLTLLAKLIGLGFIVGLINTVLNSISERLGDHFSGRLRKFLTEMFYRKVLTLPQSYFDGELSGKIVNQLNRGIESIRGFTNTATNFIVPTFLQSLLTLSLLFYYNKLVALLTFILFPIYGVLTHFSTKKWGAEEIKKNKIEDINRGRIQEVISNIKLVKTYTNERREYDLVSDNQTEINKIYAKQSNAFHIYDFFRNLSLTIVLLGINIIIFYQTFTGNLSIGEMILIIQLVAQARYPLFSMSFILSQIQYAESGSKEFFEILDLKSSEEFATSERDTNKIQNPTISFDNVHFNYQDSKEVLKGISFTVKPQEKIALVGHSGAGKTTIINMILKFYNPSTGSIFLNEQNYQDLSHYDVRNNIALVFQDNELFSSTVKENITYGNPKASKEQIIAALKKANAYEFVMAFKKGINTEIGERGVKLSGGQKQRIQIARAILNDAPILILDEATSSLDSKSESMVQEAMENLMHDKLVIIIAHRLSTIQNVDRILVLDDGKIVDQGSPAALAKRKGIYADLLHYQIAGNKKLLTNYEIY